VKKLAIFPIVIGLCGLAGLSFLWLMNYGTRPFWRPFANISLMSIEMYDAKTGQVVRCNRESNAQEGVDETPAMKACVAKFASQGFIQGVPPRVAP
jgi:hypothetical protein